MLQNMFGPHINILPREQASIIVGNTIKHQHPITYVSVMYQGSQLNRTGCFNQISLCDGHGS